MANEQKCVCKIWLSGFFGLGALVHLVRFVTRVPVTIGSYDVPVSLSGILAIVFAVLSVGLLFLKCCCCQKKSESCNP